MSESQSVATHQHLRWRDDAARIASHRNSADALESCDTLACVRALRAIERKTCLVTSCGRSSPGVVGAQAPHLSRGAVGAATYEASLVREALKDLGPNIEQATFVAEGDNGRSVVPEREGGAGQLAIARHLRTRVGQLEPKLTAGEQVVTVWPRADRVTRSREHPRARSVVASSAPRHGARGAPFYHVSPRPTRPVQLSSRAQNHPSFTRRPCGVDRRIEDRPRVVPERHRGARVTTNATSCCTRHAPQSVHQPVVPPLPALGASPVVTCVYRGTHSTYCEGETAVRREQSARLTPYVVSQAQAPLKTPKRIKIVLVFSSSYCGAK